MTHLYHMGTMNSMCGPIPAVAGMSCAKKLLIKLASMRREDHTPLAAGLLDSASYGRDSEAPG
ncbi:hypothetical protein M378DRAFT_318243 [Amanita muscaria Koide BX008]|uniref:Uncharacterized protein n=1 Tax=Amanita muscaria (strain Koide BX008) TaxID=946122 RepID=A0A0C2S6L6_AMAMK|nr:hypothetical protein M378DRAFT_318243 [Amanita muscaria Koide BX008]